MTSIHTSLTLAYQNVKTCVERISRINIIYLQKISNVLFQLWADAEASLPFTWTAGKTGDGMMGDASDKVGSVLVED